jgi:hypothetical protein
MSRYFLLLLLNTPFILAGILTALTQYKLRHATRRRMIVQIGFWIVLFASLASAQIIYESLFSYGLTQTESLSLFDVVQITLIVTLVYAFNRMRMKLEVMDRRVSNLHQELSIRLSSPASKR